MTNEDDRVPNSVHEQRAWQKTVDKKLEALQRRFQKLRRTVVLAKFHAGAARTNLLTELRNDVRLPSDKVFELDGHVHITQGELQTHARNLSDRFHRELDSLRTQISNNTSTILADMLKTAQNAIKGTQKAANAEVERLRPRLDPLVMEAFAHLTQAAQDTVNEIKDAACGVIS